MASFNCGGGSSRGVLSGEKTGLDLDMGNIMKYSNGWGHLIMSIFFGLAGLALILDPQTDSTMKGIGVSVLLTVSGAWFIPSAAKQMAYQVVEDKAIPTDPPTPAPAPAQGVPPSA